jgi:hypothetical protein
VDGSRRSRASSPRRQLREVVRQRDPEERAALEALRDGEPGRYIAHKQDAISVHAIETEALAAIVEQWDAACDQYGLQGVVVIARGNHTRERLNHAARSHLRQDGAIRSTGVVVSGREFTAGDRVIAAATTATSTSTTAP